MKTEAQTILDAAALALPTREIDGRSFALVPEGCKLLDLEALQSTPSRKAGKTTVLTADAFAQAIKHQGVTESAAIYYDPTAGRFVAVLNDFKSDNFVGAHRDHIVVYNAPQSIEWVTWKAHDKKQMSQEQFAQFIEDNLPDITQPEAADMLEISRSLEAKKKVDFSSAIRLSNGQHQIAYEEEIQGSASKGRLEIPEIFKIAIPVMQGADRYAMDARLRFRIGNDKHLVMWFELIRPHKVWEHALKEVATKIGADTGLLMIAASL